MGNIFKEEFARRLKAYDSMYVFIHKFAKWDGTADSWYNLFKMYQKEANDVLDEIKPK